MKYKITIVKEIDNPDYDKDAAERAKNVYNSRYDEGHKISKILEVDALKVDLTEDEFKAIKKAVLEII